ncbi:MAG TPA: HAD hydrolase family protein [Alphaproteobacteria bacterium]|nr:HAD hydrolase family protein [Alphaproteobacteria bacterium]
MAKRAKSAARPRLDPARVALIVFDFDGVLTDNRVLVLEDGREAVLCSRADGLGFDALRAARIPTLILSTERNPVVAARARKLGVPVLQAVADKAQALEAHCIAAGIALASVVYVGNDLNDLKAMGTVGHPVAVADAHERVRKAARYVLKAAGGEGAARELVERLMGLAVG